MERKIFGDTRLEFTENLNLGRKELNFRKGRASLDEKFVPSHVPFKLYK